MIEGLRGRGPIAFDGALHFLARHQFAVIEDATAVRALCVVLDGAGIVAGQPATDDSHPGRAAEEGDRFEPVVRVIERDRPFSHAMHLRQMLRSCEGYLHWAQPHLPRKALESLALESTARESKRSSSSRPPKEEELAAYTTDWHRFSREVAAVGVVAEWRLVHPRALDLHDRYIIGKNSVWNVPPVNSIHKGDYAEAFKTENRPPFDRWWNGGTPL